MLGGIRGKIVSLIAATLLFTFIIGLAYSIATGFAGFWGGLPFICIVTFVLSMAGYDVWDENLRKKK